jgi:flagellar L-ring protein precursor FlgH
MRKTDLLSVALMVGAVGAARTGLSEDLWEKRTPGHAFLYYDTQARHVGDKLTIVVREDSNVQNNDNRGMKKATGLKSAFSFAGAASGGLGEQEGGVSASESLTSDRAMQGNATFRSQRAFTDRMTVTVVDVLPNGDLVVRGTRELSIQGDVRTLVVTGVVRYFDIGPDNSVSSRLVSDLRMVYDGAGAEQAFTRQGWMGRIGNKLWPF